ncbi:MAG: hypothetical protein JWR26_2410 [Pedosphaera sp.]|nr:hypothetical protein [Pedosphaera sp.]
MVKPPFRLVAICKDPSLQTPFSPLPPVEGSVFSLTRHELFLVFMTSSIPHLPCKIVIYGRFDIIFLKTALLKKNTIPTNVYRAFTKTAKFFTNHPSEK